MKSLKGLMTGTLFAWVVACLLGAMATSREFQEWLNDGQELQFQELFKALLSGQLVFALFIGLIAIATFYELLDRSDSLRVPIAAAVTIVFFAFLLFPEVFSSATPLELRDDFIRAWTVTTAFYFAAEAAVQATKVVQARKERTELAGRETSPPRTTTAAQVPGDAQDLKF